MRATLLRPEVRFPATFAALAVLGAVLYRALPTLRQEAQAWTVHATAAACRWTGLQAHVGAGGSMSFADGGFGFTVTEGCSGLAIACLFASAVLAYPSSWRQRGAGLAVGLAAIFALNVVRIVSMAWLGVAAPARFEEAHLFWWQALFVLCVGLGWLAWAQLATGRRPRGWLHRLGASGAIFLGVFVSLWFVGVYAAGIEAYGRLLMAVAPPMAQWSWGVELRPTASEALAGHFLFMYGLLAAAAALYAATPAGSWRTRMAGTLCVCVPSVVAVNVAWLVLRWGMKAGEVPPSVYGVVHLSAVQVGIPILAWLVWSGRLGAFTLRKAEAAHACPECGSTTPDLLGHLKGEHRGKARKLRRRLMVQHPDLQRPS